jgi:small subunit ribosomal protein S2e
MQMADAPPAAAPGRGGFSRGFGDGGRGGRDGGRGRGRDGRGRGRGRGKREDEDQWIPCTKLGRLVQQGKIKSMEQMYRFSLPIKEYQIVDQFLGSSLKVNPARLLILLLFVVECQ